MLNEAETRVKLIDPLLHACGWLEEAIEREKPITRGRAREKQKSQD
jgi:type I site-specific restriction endonuclease